MAKTREIKRRIKAVSNTKKITRTMELVAASKMRKAIANALMGRSYAEYAWRLLIKLSQKYVDFHPLLTIRPVRKMCLILITSDKGLCGAYNSQLIRKVVKQLKDPRLIMVNRVGDLKISPEIDPNEVTVDIITVGKKGEEAMKRFGYNVVASFINLGDRPSIADIRPIVKISIEDYKKQRYDKIVVVYTDFVSTIKQIPKFRQLLPISKYDLEKVITEIGDIEEMEKRTVETEAKAPDYIFEPSPDIVLEYMLNRLVEVQLYQMILESNASEHSARMVAMRNANNAANDMLFELTLQFNQARQAAITQEITEISSGKAVLEA